MVVAGGTVLRAVGLAGAAVDAEHDGGLRPARMHPVFPGPGGGAERDAEAELGRHVGVGAAALLG